MSRGFVKDGDQEEVPIVPPRAFLPEGAVNYVTTEGMELLLNEKEELLNNIESIAGNEVDKRIEKNYLKAKLHLLEQRICSAVVSDSQKIAKDEVGFGAWITIKMEGDDKSRIIKITGVDESDALKGYITYFSPLSLSIAGHKEGETVEVTMPTGKRKVEIINISYSKPSEPFTDISTETAIPDERQKHTKPNIAQEPVIIKKRNPETTPITNHTTTQKENEHEILPVVNERGITIGHAPRWQCHDGSKLLHPVVHLHVFNSKGDLYLQLRPSWKKIQPDKWDTAVGGHVSFGESIDKALARESKEELGIEKFTPILIKKYIFESAREKELVNTYRTTYDAYICPSNELADGRFWSISEIRKSIGKKVFTPNFEKEFLMIDKQI